MLINSIKIYLGISFIVSVIFLVYFPGLNSQFQFDDYPNIVNNQRLHLQSLSLGNISKATLSGNSSILQRPISMLSFALNYYFSELSPFPYKLTNLFIHIFNSLGIYWLSFLLLKKAKLTNIILPSLIIALVWAIHPINLTSVLYVVQRMTSLSAFFVILSMIIYLNAKNNLHNNKLKKGILGLIAVVFTSLCSILSKENGALVFVFLLLLELVFFQDFKSSNPKIRLTNIIFFSFSLVIPSLFISGFSLLKPEWITSGYAGTAFTLTERLLTEARVVWLYIFWILLPNNKSLGLFHDDIAISHSLFDATFPFLSGLGHFLFIAFLTFLWIKRKQPLFVFGCAFFYCSHLIESTVIPLELAHEHRNYLGSFGLLLATLSLLLSLDKTNIKPIQFGIPVYMIFLALLTMQRASQWGNGIESALVEVVHHPESAAANYELARQYSAIDNTDFLEKAIFHFKKAAALDKSRADGLFAILTMESRNKHPLNSELFKELKSRLSSGPAYASHASWLSSLIKCYTNAECFMEEAQIASIIQAALDNKKLHHNKLTESFTLMATAGFLTSGRNNYENALELSVIAANASPGNVIFIKNIIDLAISFKDYNTAHQWITIFEAQPYAYLLRDEIQSLKNNLPIS